MNRKLDNFAFSKARQAQTAADLANGDLSSLVAQVNALQGQVSTLSGELSALQNAYNTHTHAYSDIDNTGNTLNKNTNAPA